MERREKITYTVAERCTSFQRHERYDMLANCHLIIIYSPGALIHLPPLIIITLTTQIIKRFVDIELANARGISTNV